MKTFFGGKANTILGDIVFSDALEVFYGVCQVDFCNRSMVSRQETSYSTFAFSFNFVTMDVRGSRDLAGARVAMDTDPRCVHALGMDKRLGFPDLEGLRLAMDADPRGILAIGDQNIRTRTWKLLLLTFPIPEEQGWRDPQTDWRPEA